jgi:hypothetical protein
MSNLTWLADEKAVWRFNKTLADDFAVAIPGLDVAMIRMRNLTNGFSFLGIRFFLQEMCGATGQDQVQSTSSFITPSKSAIQMIKNPANSAQQTQTRMQTQVQGHGRKLLQTAPTNTRLTLGEMAELIRKMLNDKDSALFRGVITSQLDPASVEILDPTTPQPEDGLEWWAYLLITLACLSVCVIGGFLCWRYEKAGGMFRRASAAIRKRTEKHKAVEFSSPISSPNNPITSPNNMSSPNSSSSWNSNSNNGYRPAPPTPINNSYGNSNISTNKPAGPRTAQPPAIPKRPAKPMGSATANKTAPRPPAPRSPKASANSAWSQQYDENGSPYWMNEETGETSWNKP